MKRLRLRTRTLLVVVALIGVVLALGTPLIRRRQYTFNVLVSRGVGRHSTLARLEAVAGRAARPAPTDRLAKVMKQLVAKDSLRYPDGWRDGDSWVYYQFADGYRMWFQVRNGRLVNYDPAILASQPQLQPIATVGP